MRCIAIAVLLVTTALLLLGQVKAADVNDAFDAWLRPPKLDLGKATAAAMRMDTELRQGLEGFLYLQNRRALEQLVETSPAASPETGLLAGIITSASKLVDADAGTIGEKIEALGHLLDRLPDDLEVWPLVRRVVVASLALRYGKHGPFASGTVAPIVQDTLVQLYDQLKQSAKRKAVMEYAHVSKSGGTSFCQLAKANGCSSEDFGWGNCLMKPFHDGPRYINGEQHKRLAGGVKTKCARPFKRTSPRKAEVSCADRRSQLLERGYSMYANEYTALGGIEDPALAHPCRNMFTVIEVRHPFGRVVSHLKHIWFLYQYHCGTAGRDIYFAGGRNRNTTAWAELMPGPVNNYLIRSLLGEKVFNSPVGSITAEHLDLARAFLAEQYDVVVVLEDKPLFRHVLRHGLGWGVDSMHANSRGDGRDAKEGVPADLEALWALNALDVQLYEFGTLMAKLDAVLYDAAARVASASLDEPQKEEEKEGRDGRGLKGLLSDLVGRTRDTAGHKGGAGAGSAGSGSFRRPFMTPQRKSALNEATATKTAVAGRSTGALPACGWVGSRR